MTDHEECPLCRLFPYHPVKEDERAEDDKTDLDIDESQLTD